MFDKRKIHRQYKKLFPSSGFKELKKIREMQFSHHTYLCIIKQGDVVSYRYLV